MRSMNKGRGSIIEISTGNSRRINQKGRDIALGRFGVSKERLLAAGTEAEVYEIDEERVLKIYKGDALTRLQTLQKFYEAVDESGSGVKIPRIIQVSGVSGVCAVVESRIPGVSLESILPSLKDESLSRAEDIYLQAVHTLGRIRVRKEPESYLLFDSSGRSTTKGQSWAGFYETLLREKLAKIGPVIETVVPEFGPRSQKLLDSFHRDRFAARDVVHGDFFAGNVLVEPNLTKVHGVIDFGSFTMFGDHLLDVAGAFGFFRMYEPNRAAIRKALLPKVLSVLAPEEQPRFFRYLLSHAILTSDLYVSEPDPRQNGHFCWAAEVLSEPSYWEGQG